MAQRPTSDREGAMRGPIPHPCRWSWSALCFSAGASPWGPTSRRPNHGWPTSGSRPKTSGSRPTRRTPSSGGSGEVSTRPGQLQRACDRAGVKVPFQEGTRHSTPTALSGARPERMFQAFDRHRDQRSLSHDAKPRPTPAAIVEALNQSRLDPRRTHGRSRPKERHRESATCGGADGTRTRPLQI